MKIKMKTAMKHIRTKVALNKKLDTNEYQLVVIAAKKLIKNINNTNIRDNWDIKLQNALANIIDIDGNVVPHYYFQLVACESDIYLSSQFHWISEEIVKLMLDNIGVINNKHILFSSNNLNISVNLKDQVVMLQRIIHRGKAEMTEVVRVYTYNYELDNLVGFANNLITASK